VSSRPIRIAAQLHPQHGTYPSIRTAVARAESLGYDIVYNWDHFFPLYGDPGGAHFEAWTMLAAWAEQTSRIELGPLVTCNSYRNPQLLADMARTVDHIAGGRLILGIGSGWFERDYEEYGYAFGTARERSDALVASLPRLLDRLDRLEPAAPRRIPILIGGSGPNITLRLVARHAQIWHAGFPDHASELESAVGRLGHWCAVEGRDAAGIERSVGVEPGDLDRFLDDEAQRAVELGFTQFTLGFNGPDWDVAAGGRWLRWRDEQNRPPAAGDSRP
jgi:probable F420-dependent oxidoreductase